MTNKITDIHTHSIKPDANCNVGIESYCPESPYYFSIGIHPWNAGHATKDDLDRIKEIATNKNILAIGETGIDHSCDASPEKQMYFFKEHAILAETVKKPLIIHNVKGTDEIVKLRKELNPKVPWIIHGFRGKPQLAKQLTDKGIYLSFGEKYNAETIKSVLPQYIVAETDESLLPIMEIYDMIAETKGWNRNETEKTIKENISRIFTTI